MFNIVNTKNLSSKEREIISSIITKYNNKQTNNKKYNLPFESKTSTDSFHDTLKDQDSLKSYLFTSLEKNIRNPENDKVIFLGIPRNQRKFAWQQLLTKNTNYLIVISSFKSKSTTFKGCIIRFLKNKIFTCNKIQLKISPEKERIIRQQSIDSDSVIQIHRDIQRTYTHHFLYKEKYGLGQKRLFQFLINFSIKYPEIGYCQGLSNIIALLLIYLEIKEAEKFFENFLHKNNLINLYDQKLTKLNFILKIGQKYLKKFLHKKKFEEIKKIVPVFSMKWYLSLFTVFPMEFTDRIFDLLFYFGFPILILVSVSIFKIYNIHNLNEENIEIEIVLRQVRKFAKRKILFELYDDYFN